jgi:hypothetical protein
MWPTFVCFDAQVLMDAMTGCCAVLKSGPSYHIIFLEQPIKKSNSNEIGLFHCLACIAVRCMHSSASYMNDAVVISHQSLYLLAFATTRHARAPVPPQLPLKPLACRPAVLISH